MAYIGPEPNPGQNREVDDISSSFNGSTTAFTLQVNSQNVSPGSSNSIIVSLGGVVQNPSTDYTINSSTITFSTAPASGLSFFGLVLGQGVDAVEPADGSVSTIKIADQAVTLAKLPHGTASNNGKFLRANNGADPTFETVTGTTINNNADNRVITGSGTANTLEGEANLTFDGTSLLALHVPSATGEPAINFTNSDTGTGTGNGFGLGISSSESPYIYNRENTDLRIATNNTERLRILAAGGLTFNGDTAAANALDDYEEGSAAITVGSANLGINTSYNVCDYTKVGNLVTITMLLIVSSVSGSDNILINLPFQNRSESNPRRTDAIGVTMHNGVNTGDAGMVGYLPMSSTQLRFYKVSDNAGWAILNNSDLAVNDEIYCTITYKTV